MAPSGPTIIENPTPSVPAQAPATPSTVTARAVGLALLLLPINAHWVIQMEAVRDTAHPTPISLCFNCIFFAVGGFTFAAFLQALRVRFPWWPLHPLAFAVKSLLLRYGGLKRYQASLPFFCGLILGQFVPGSLLNIWGTVTGASPYRFWN